MVPLKYLSNFWRTPGTPLVNCEINIFLVLSEECFIVNGRNYVDRKPKFAITDTKLIPVVIL